jgi:hypothetical protein
MKLNNEVDKNIEYAIAVVPNDNNEWALNLFYNVGDGFVSSRDIFNSDNKNEKLLSIYMREVFRPVCDEGFVVKNGCLIEDDVYYDVSMVPRLLLNLEHFVMVANDVGMIREGNPIKSLKSDVISNKLYRCRKL